MNGTCKAKTRSGEHCKARVSQNGFCAIHADPSRASELGRRSGTARRYVLNAKGRLPALPVPQTALDVRKVLGQVMADLRARRLDTRVASALAYVGNVMLRAIEVGDFEERMSKLENMLTAGKTEST
jgi:hypothetical protein